MRKLALMALCLTFAAAATPAAAKDNCGVTFYKYSDLKGPSVSFFGPGQVRDLDDVEYPNGEDLDNDVHSVGTLANSWLELYADEDFKKPVYRLPPNTWRNVKNVESYRIACRGPQGDYGPMK